MIVYIGGAKGGVGKSLLAMIALSYHAKADMFAPILFETDTSNPDVLKSYAQELSTVQEDHKGKGCEIFDFDVETECGRLGALRLITESLKEQPDRTIVINSGARNQKAVEKLRKAFTHLPLITLWLVNTQADSVALLKEYLETIGDANTCVIKNGYFGEAAAFSFFDGSKTAKRVPAVYLAHGPGIVMDKLYTGRKAVHELEDSMEIFEWWESEEWVAQAENVYVDAIKKARD